ncbi:TetR/AcrR family transcriptional regulator [Paenibacillus sp. SI8]
MAKRLFAENGYHATSMRTINREIGVTEALTYHYFPGGKLEILHTIVREEHEKKVDDYTDVIQAFNDDVPFRDALLLFAHRTSERFTKDKELLQILIQDRKLLDREQLAAFSQMGQQPMTAIIHFLEKHAREGHIREMDYRLAVRQIVYHIGFTAINQIIFEFSAEEDYNKHIEKIVDFTIGLWSK